MIIAMPRVVMVQMSRDEVIEMITVRDALVSTCWSVDVPSVVTAAIVIRCTPRRICPVYGDFVLIYMAGMQMMQMTIVKVIGMIFMKHSHMATT
jgi:hypothetical protein